MAGMRMEIRGLSQLSDLLLDVAPREAEKLARKTIGKVGTKAVQDIRALVPVDEGRLKRAVSKRNVKKRDLPRGTVGVDITVKQMSDQGRRQDPRVYWRFIEFGTFKRHATPFIQPGMARARAQLPRDFREIFGQELERALQRQGPDVT